MRRADGARIRALRERAGESQEAMAARTGVGRNTLRLIECGQSLHPRPLTMRALADALGVTVDEITINDRPGEKAASA